MISTKSYRYAFRVFLFSIPFQSIAVISIYDFGVQPVHIGLIIAVTATLLYISSNPIQLAKAPVFVTTLFVLLLIILFMWGYLTPEIPYLTPPRPNRPGQLLYWLVAIDYFVVAYLAAANLNSIENAYRDWHWLISGGLVSVAIGTYHYIAFYTGIPFPSEVIFSNPSWGLNVETRISGILRFVGPFPEPSMFARFTVVALGVAYGLRERASFFIFLVTIILSLSTTGLIGVAVFGTLLIVKNWRDPLVQSAVRIIAAITPVAFLIPTARSAFWALTVGKIDSISVQQRSAQLIGGLLAWIERPLLGWGLGVERTNDGLSFLLINFGLIGIIPIAWLLIRPLNTKTINTNSLFNGLQIGLVSVIALHIVSGPDWTLPYVWTLSGYLWGVSVSQTNK